MTRADIERFVRDKTGVITPGTRDRRADQVLRYPIDPLPIASGYGRPSFTPPGFLAIDTTSATALPTNRTTARYLGQAPDDLNAVTLRFNVLTAAVTITWAEVGIATSGYDVTLGAGEDMRTEGWVDVATTFNSVGIKNTEIPVAIGKGAHVWALFGSQATTPFQVSRGLGDAINQGFMQFADATRPSTMANPTTFAVTGATANAAWIGVLW